MSNRRVDNYDKSMKPQLTDVEERKERLRNMVKEKQKNTSGNTLKRLAKPNDIDMRTSYMMYKHGFEINGSGRPLSYQSEEYLLDVINEFMEFVYDEGINPTNTGLALWLGIDIATLDEWTYDSSHVFSQILKRTMLIFKNYAEQKAMNGELSPLIYFFQAKNYWGMSDKTEIVHKSSSTSVIDVSEQNRILTSAPGIILDAEIVNTKSENEIQNTKSEILNTKSENEILNFLTGEDIPEWDDDI